MSASNAAVRVPSAPAVVEAHDADADATQRRAETIYVRSIMWGMVFGVVVCAAIWIGLVAVATVHNGVPSGPLLAMGAGCGAFAGLFLGGTTGAMLGSRALEHAEIEEAHASHRA